jgi:hypothetical protein
MSGLRHHGRSASERIRVRCGVRKISPNQVAAAAAWGIIDDTNNAKHVTSSFPYKRVIVGHVTQ